MISQKYLPLGYQQITGLTAAASLTVPTGTTDVLLSAEGAPVRFRDDGVAPTTSVGMLLPIGVVPYLYSGTVSALQFIQASATGILNVSFYRRAG